MQLSTSIAVLGSLLVEQQFLSAGQKIPTKTLFEPAFNSAEWYNNNYASCSCPYAYRTSRPRPLFPCLSNASSGYNVHSTAEPHPNQDSVLIGHLQPRRAPIRTGPPAQIPTSSRIPPLYITFVEGIEVGQPLQNVDIGTSAKDIVKNSVEEFAQYHQRTLSFLNNYRPSYIDYTRGIRFWVHDTLPNNLCHRYCAGVASLGSDNVSEFYYGLLNSNSESFPEINWEEI
ncbi:hypothetical protein F5051DRAFT_443520 [Lentinula edodes]|nr:hypothetical protein F5051DRAFT_443520 [Lentinula edodes]